jgi:fucose 4-O-acetylase-like acetyltransferase
VNRNTNVTPNSDITTTAKRLPFLDFAKGVLILLVTIGHAVQFIAYHNAAEGDGFWVDPLFKGIYLFHMPLFMGISGYLSQVGLQRTALWPFLSGKVRTYLIPIMIWALLYQTASYAAGLGHGGLVALPRAIFSEALTQLWFLWALLGCLVVTAFTRLTGRAFWPVYGAMTFLVLFLPETGNLIMFKFMFPFFQVGYLISAVRFTSLATGRGIALFLFAAVLTVAVYTLWEKETYIYQSGMVLTLDNLRFILMRLIAGLAGSALIMMILHQAYTRLGTGIRDAVAALGRDSIYVYILQTYFFILFNRVSWRLPPMHEPVWAAMLIAISSGFMVAVGCWIAGRWLSTNSVAHEVLFGKIRRKNPCFLTISSKK